MKILYFTATGNNLSVAKRFDAELLSIPQMIKNNNYQIEDDKVGIIYPIYSLSVPLIVKQYLEKCIIKANYVFVIATYGFTSGGSLHEMRKILDKNGNHADYYESLLMIDNFLPFFDINQQINSIKDKNIENRLNLIVNEVKEGIKKQENCNKFNKLMSLCGNIIINRILRFIPKLFHISDDCIGCGICKNVCPVSNIIQEKSNKPQYYNKCVGCLSCIHNCPKNAINMKFQKSRKRFRNEETTVKEIIDSNNTWK